MSKDNPVAPDRGTPTAGDRQADLDAYKARYPGSGLPSWTGYVEGWNDAAKRFEASLGVPAGQRTADRETIAQAIHDGPNAQTQYAKVGIGGHTWKECPYKDQYRADADAVLAVLLPADLIRAEALDTWAATVRAEAEADERGLLDIPFDELPQSSRIMLNGVTRAAERAVARATEYRKAAGA